MIDYALISEEEAALLVVNGRKQLGEFSVKMITGIQRHVEEIISTQDLFYQGRARWESRRFYHGSKP